jgi:hypothetical protein
MRIEHRHLARRRWIVGQDFDKRPRRKISFDMIAGPLDQSQPQPSQRDIRLRTRDRDHHGDLDTPKLANRSAVRSKAHRHEGGSGRQLISNLMPQGRENRGAQTLRLTVCTVGSSMYLSVQIRSLQMSRPPLPPFTRETTAQKARMAEDAWNSCDPERVSVGEDRVLHLNTSFTWAYLDLGVYAHTRAEGCLPHPPRSEPALCNCLAEPVALARARCCYALYVVPPESARPVPDLGELNAWSRQGSIPQLRDGDGYHDTQTNRHNSKPRSARVRPICELNRSN